MLAEINVVVDCIECLIRYLSNV